MKVETAEEAIKVIEDLKIQFSLKGFIWGDDQIVQVLEDGARYNGSDYAERNYPQIIQEVKESPEWHNLSVGDEASDIWDEIRKIVVKVADSVTLLENELGTIEVNLADFEDRQIELFNANKHQKDDAYLAHLMQTTPAKVRGLRKYQDQLTADLKRLSA